MKKLYKAIILASSITLTTVNAGGVPTFDGIHVGVGMRELTESLMQTYKLIQQYKTQLEQLAKQKEQFRNQFGELSGLITELQNLEFIRTADGYIPADWNEAVKVLEGISDNMPGEVKTHTDQILERFKDIDIKDEISKNILINENEELTGQLGIYFTQMKIAQDRLHSAGELSNKLANVKTQKEREALNAQVNIENLKTQAETANILATKNAQDLKAHYQQLESKKQFRELFDDFVDGEK